MDIEGCVSWLVQTDKKVREVLPSKITASTVGCDYTSVQHSLFMMFLEQHESILLPIQVINGILCKHHVSVRFLNHLHHITRDPSSSL